jgi:glucokinase
MLLAGDIGGTKTILALYSKESGANAPFLQKTYASAQFASLESIVKEFLGFVGQPVESACFGVAGPVFGWRAQITNLTWVVEAAALRSAFGWQEVALLNDLEAVAYAIPALAPGDVCELSAGNPVPGGNLAVLAPGTGLGEAYVTVQDGRYVAHASEGSHASFAPMNALQVGLLSFLHEKMGYEHVSYERVCSGGLGIPNLYAYLKETGYTNEPAWLADALAACDDPTPVIIAAALDEQRPCALCQAVLDLFISILGAEAGNQALKVMATGGNLPGGRDTPAHFAEIAGLGFLRSAAHERPLPGNAHRNPGAGDPESAGRVGGRCSLWF